MNPDTLIKPLHVLLIEDDEVDVMNVNRAFRKMAQRPELSVATDAITALEMLRSRQKPLPQIILLDINMPRMDGLEFLSELRADPLLNGISVFVMTTSENPADMSMAFKLNVSGYIVKPLSAEKFNHAIEQLMNLWTICSYPNA